MEFHTAEEFSKIYKLRLSRVNEENFKEVLDFLTETFLEDRNVLSIFHALNFTREEFIELISLNLLDAKPWWENSRVVYDKNNKICLCYYGRDLFSIKRDPKMNPLKNPKLQFKRELDYELLKPMLAKISKIG